LIVGLLLRGNRGGLAPSFNIQHNAKVSDGGGPQTPEYGQQVPPAATGSTDKLVPLTIIAPNLTL